MSEIYTQIMISSMPVNLDNAISAISTEVLAILLEVGTLPIAATPQGVQRLAPRLSKRSQDAQQLLRSCYLQGNYLTTLSHNTLQNAIACLLFRFPLPDDPIEEFHNRLTDYLQQIQLFLLDNYSGNARKRFVPLIPS
jgi:hypothetical protein